MALHGGYGGDATGATAVPVSQTTSFAYATAQELADVFAGRAPGYIYTRIANPTTSVLEARLTGLEDGIGCIATASGMAAIASVAVGLLKAGEKIVAAAGIFGGTVSLFKNTLGRFGIETELVDVADSSNFARAIDEKTRLVFIETIGNPRMDVPDIPAVAAMAHEAGIPLVVDNTATTPYLIRPGDHGADIVVHSTSKFINGHGTAIGGAIVDTGNFDWRNGPFDDIAALARRAGNMAFLSHQRNLIYRDLGGCPAPMNSFLMLQGLETLPGRMDKHCENATKLAEFLSAHPSVRRVNYPALADNPFRPRVEAMFGGLAGGLLTLGLGDKATAFAFIDSLRLAKDLANLGDAKTLVIHPASTIFHEFDATQLETMGIAQDMVRVSVGIENIEDIRADFEQALAKATKEDL